MFEHKIYTFLIHLLFTSHLLSHFVIQFILAPSSEQRPNLSVSFFGSCSPKLVFYVPINKSVRYGLM